MLVSIDCGTCWLCNKQAVLDLELAAPQAEIVKRWIKQPDNYIQDELWFLTPDQRELIISGTHTECFNKAFYAE